MNGQHRGAKTEFARADYARFFEAAMGVEPFEYQRRFAEAEEMPELVQIPTGMGKTAMVIVGWLWRRFGPRADLRAGTPTRLVYCLPMRVLVEQTVENARTWIHNLVEADLLGSDGPGVHVLMGGEQATDWDSVPEREALLIGTQDMLLSRALMRGYGMSRYRWPVHFALLHNDALWVYDEVQLMGPAVATTAQLEGFRRMQSMRPARATRSVWLSATLNPDWLDTIDLRPHRDSLAGLGLTEAETEHPLVKKRREAAKTLRKAATKLGRGHQSKAGLKEYAQSLAGEVLAEHNVLGDTLVVLNRVDRAQAVYDALRSAEEAPTFLIHARFRAAERKMIEREVRGAGDRGRIIVATQAIEAGVDLTSRRLFTELAPWSSLVQRFGRCNRYGESDDAAVYWIDMEQDEKLAPPYSSEALWAARKRVENLNSASPALLPPVDEPASVEVVLRRRDLFDLFNNDPDLSGFDVDVSPYIRDAGSPQVDVFWREFEGRPAAEEPRSQRQELCPVSLPQIRAHLDKGAEAFVWDGLGGSWRRIYPQQIVPGSTIMLRAAQGGYLPDRGFSPGSRVPVEPLVRDGEAESPSNSDPETAIGRYVTLTEHLGDVAGEAERLGIQLDLDGEDLDAAVTAARWHDVGKAHPAFQTPLRKQGDLPPHADGSLWAKSVGTGRLDYHMSTPDGDVVRRPHFRHELASMLTWLEHSDGQSDRDLVAFLIAAHHGKVRLNLRALPGENEPPEGVRFARGIWEGDQIPEVVLNGFRVPPTVLKLDLMELGWGEQGPSWTERTQRLLAEYGPFRLSWLEALVRVADWRASREEQHQPVGMVAGQGE